MEGEERGKKVCVLAGGWRWLCLFGGGGGGGKIESAALIETS